MRWCTLPTLTISVHTTGGSQAFVEPHIFRHAQTQTLAQALTLSDGIGLVLHKTKNLEILDKYQNKAELCLACTHTTPLPYTHTHPARWPPPPYAKNYHTSFSLYPYLNMMEKNWAFIRGGGCVFIQQRQHQETRESPHCCWWKQERVGDCGAGGRRGEWRRGERERDRRRKELFEWQ